MNDVKKVLLVSICLCLGQGLIQSSFANSSNFTTSAPVSDQVKPADMDTGKQNHTQKATQNVHIMLSDIITDESYSRTIHQTKWVYNDPPKPVSDEHADIDLNWLAKLIQSVFTLSKHVGVFGKTIAILFLVLLAWWLYRTRDYWLSWVEKLAPIMKKRTPQIDHVPHIAQDVWAELPPTDELVAYVQKLLQKSEYLLALSVLYRGTLRELNAHHALAIDKHQTEDECAWLLAKSPASPQESAYFAKLVALWRICAYGQKFAPQLADGNGHQVFELAQSWSALYGQRG
ncbi:DUF4129 domain-containing protein [Moraxella oblonga]|uniref:DUF4129 domain-containing protein n=1 Tax=Moraxella oblonga TaxID=200413 RepID=UPI000831E15E|nr:DUF4129 domain-containing protein [Moraxella oblonga]